MVLLWTPGAKGHAIPACEDFSGLIYASMKMSDVPGFSTMVQMSVTMVGYIAECAYLVSLRKIFGSWDLSRLPWAETLCRASLHFPARETSESYVIRKGEGFRSLLLTSLDSFQSIPFSCSSGSFCCNKL